MNVKIVAEAVDLGRGTSSLSPSERSSIEVQGVSAVTDPPAPAVAQFRIVIHLHLLMLASLLPCHFFHSPVTTTAESTASVETLRFR